MQSLKVAVLSMHIVRSGLLRRHLYKANVTVRRITYVSDAQPQDAAQGISVVHRNMWGHCCLTLVSNARLPVDETSGNCKFMPVGSREGNSVIPRNRMESAVTAALLPCFSQQIILGASEMSGSP